MSDNPLWDLVTGIAFLPPDAPPPQVNNGRLRDDRLLPALDSDTEAYEDFEDGDPIEPEPDEWEDE